MSRLAIIGHAKDKFTPATQSQALELIGALLDLHPDSVISGRSPLGGVDIWAEALADQRGIPTDIKAPRTMNWTGEYGFRERNLAIALAADEVHVVVVAEYPQDYTGARFGGCYHCIDRNPSHVKSGACWTAWKAHEMGKRVVWHII